MGALRPEIVLAVVARTAAVLVLIAPRILGDRLLEVRAVPVGGVRIPLERVEALARVGVRAAIEPVLVERRTKQLDRRRRRRLLGLAHAAEEARTDESHEQPEHDDDDEQLDQREPALIPERPTKSPTGAADSCSTTIRELVVPGREACRRGRQGPVPVIASTDLSRRDGAQPLWGSGRVPRGPVDPCGTPPGPGQPAHSRISLIEKIASLIATTMKATSTPMLKMMTGSRSRSTRFSSVPTSPSNVSATLRSMSSSRPVSSPTRTMWIASAGNGACACIPAAIVPPRFTPLASCSTARPIAWLVIVSPTTASALKTGPPILSMVPRVRANRRVSIFLARWPISSSRRPRTPPGSTAGIMLM